MKTKRYRIYIAAGTLVLLGVFAGVMTLAQEPDLAQVQQEFRRRLSDSDGVYVYVDVISKEKSVKESMTTRLREDVERELQDAEIKVLSKDELEYAPGHPHLSVFLVMYKEPGLKDVYLYTFRIVHLEDATLERNYKYAEGICWDSGLYVGIDNKTNSIVRLIRNHMRKYINDYLAANPKPPKQNDAN
jgi:hypothetical protein